MAKIQALNLHKLQSNQEIYNKVYEKYADPFITSKDLAKDLGVSQQTIIRWARFFKWTKKRQTTSIFKKIVQKNFSESTLEDDYEKKLANLPTDVTEKLSFKNKTEEELQESSAILSEKERLKAQSRAVSHVVEEFLSEKENLVISSAVLCLLRVQQLLFDNESYYGEKEMPIGIQSASCYAKLAETISSCAKTLGVQPESINNNYFQSINNFDLTQQINSSLIFEKLQSYEKNLSKECQEKAD